MKDKFLSHQQEEAKKGDKHYGESADIMPYTTKPETFGKPNYAFPMKKTEQKPYKAELLPWGQYKEYKQL